MLMMQDEGVTCQSIETSRPEDWSRAERKQLILIPPQASELSHAGKFKDLRNVLQEINFQTQFHFTCPSHTVVVNMISHADQESFVPVENRAVIVELYGRVLQATSYTELLSELCLFRLLKTSALTLRCPLPLEVVWILYFLCSFNGFQQYLDWLTLQLQACMNTTEDG